MCRSNSCMHSSGEEAIAADESLLIYCKPVELYNILHHRSLENPLFLQRCLRYKRQARRRGRLQMTLSILSTVTEGVQAPHMCPSYILLAKPLCDTALEGEQHSAVYHLIRACKVTSLTENDGTSRAEANLILPEINKLSLDVKAGKLCILLVSFGETANAMREVELSKGYTGGCCMWGRIPIESLCMSAERCLNMTLGHRAELLSNVDMRSSLLQPCRFEEGSFVAFETRNFGRMVPQQQIQVNIAANVAGEIEKSPYNSFTGSNDLTFSLSNIIRLRAGNVIFNYRDLNNMLRKSEVTEDFSCPFCLVQCACFKGLRYHLISSHDLFNFEFWVTEEYQAVNVSVKFDILKSETIADGVDPKLLTFYFCSKSRKIRRQKDPVQKTKHVFPLSLDLRFPKSTREGTYEKASTSTRNKKDLQDKMQADNCNTDIPNATDCIERVASSFNSMGVPASMPQSSVDPECVTSASGSDPSAAATLASAKSRKLERSDSKTRVLLQKRQFFHSHRAQPMALDQVLSDKDSEDEVDNDIADIEDRRMLDDFVDVTKDEKQLMHMWNSFVRKQRVLADGHVPWACEAFSKLHGQELVRAPPLFWCWRLFMIKLWNHGLLDARTMNNCNIVLEDYRTKNI